MNKRMRTAERVTPHLADNFIFQRSLLAYHRAAGLISGKVLEIGTGSGYGISTIASRATEFWTIDKNPVEIDYNMYCNTRFICKEVPLLDGMPEGYFDYVICFQVIEHIHNDSLFLHEIHRVLKPGGSLIISTPNIRRSLTRNPWHVREYRLDEFMLLLTDTDFKIIHSLGVYGNSKIETYYRQNKLAVDKILKLDFLSLVRRLPACLLRVPYDIANQLNRNQLFKQNRNMIESISMEDYCLREADDNCFDLFFVVSSV